jgi:hypothetical protein
MKKRKELKKKCEETKEIKINKRKKNTQSQAMRPNKVKQNDI